MSDLLELRTRALDLAERYVGVRESGGPNRGHAIERWLAKVGLEPGNPWCAAFLWSVYDESAAGLKIPNPIPRTGGVSKLWARAPEHMRSGLPTRGAIFVHFSEDGTYAPGRLGHCGLVLGVDGGNILTVEGNTNAEGSREGDGVWYKTRPISYAFGYLDVGREGPAVG